LKTCPIVEEIVCTKSNCFERVVNELTFPDRDRGVLINGKYKEFVKYAIAFTNGPGRTEDEDNSNKTFAGRLVISPIKMISIGGSYKTGKSPTETVGADEDEKNRYAIEMEVKYKDFLVQGEYIASEDKGSYTTGGG